MAGDAQPRTPAINDWTEQYANLVKASVLKPKHRAATDLELALFAEQCARTGLDPFLGQIYGIFRKDSRQNGAEVMTIQTGIDGFRLTAERTGKYEGQTEVEWCDAQGAWTNVWLSADAMPTAARIGVLKTAFRGPLYAVALYREFVQTYDSKPTGMWKTMPVHMLAKCVEALALRKAFPAELSGLYTVDELPVDAAVDATIVPEAPTRSSVLVAGQPPAAETLLNDQASLLTDEQRAELVATCAARGHEDMTTLLTAVGVDSTDNLTTADREAILGKLLELPAREPVEVPA